MTEKRRNYLVSEPNYHTTKFFTENVLAKKKKKKTTSNAYKYTCLFGAVNTRTEQNSNV